MLKEYEDIKESVNQRRDNTMTKRKRTYNDLQNTHKTKD